MNRDVFFPYEDLSIIDTPEDALAKRKMLVEVGAKYRSRDRYEATGGCATNVSVGLARLGVNVGVIANVGNDDLGQELLSEVSKEGVDVSLVSKKNDCKTDLSSIVVHQKTGERVIFYNRDANESFSFSKEMFSDTCFVFISGLYGDWEKSLEEVLSFCSEFSLPFFYNPSHSNISDNPRLVWETVQKARGVFLNKDEALELLTRCHEHQQMDVLYDESRKEDEAYLALFLAERGVSEFVIITDGSRGAWVYERSASGVEHSQARHPERVIDATGAGDAFTSGFLSGYILEKSHEEALSWGIRNATSVIQHYGATEGLLRKGEV
jgi:sugar/nucleoside kinase (ribokinase family)